MTRKRFYFNELSEDNVLYPLAQTAKDTLQHTEYVVKMYQKYKDVLYGLSPKEASFRMGLKNQLLFSPCLANFLCGPQDGRDSSSPETLNLAQSTLLKKYPSVPRKHSPLLNANIEASFNETTRRDKQSPKYDKDNVCPFKQVNAFNSFKSSKISGKLATNDQESVNSDEKTKMLAISAEHNKRNISTKQGSKAIKLSEEKGKSLSPKKDTILFKSMPRFIHSSGIVEIENEISSESVAEIPSTASLFSPTDHKGSRTIADVKCKTRSPKDTHLPIDESKDEISPDFSLSPKSTLTSSPTIAKTNDCSFLQIDDIDIGRDGLSCDISKVNLSENPSLKTGSSPTINLKPYTMRYCIKKLYTLLQWTDKYMSIFLNILIDFQNDLNFLYFFMENIQYVVQNILVNKDCTKPAEDFRKNIFGLATETTKLTDKIVLWEMEVDQEIPSWVKYFEEVRELKSENEPLMYNGQPLVPIEFLQKYENDLIKILQKVNDTIRMVDFRIKLFLTTAEDSVKLVNLFVKCLIYVGILKPSPKSML